MTTPPETDHNTALGLERLRGELATGLAEIKGSLALLVLRSEQSEKTAAAHAEKLETLERRLDGVEAQQTASADFGHRLQGVEKKVFAIGGACALATVAAEVLVQVFLH